MKCSRSAATSAIWWAMVGLMASTALSAAIKAPRNKMDHAQYLITFGDSFSKTGFDPKGDKPSAQNPIGNPELPGVTSAGGKNWIGWMATDFKGDLTLCYNFAQSGSTVDKRFIEGTGPDMVEQVDWFENLIVPDAPWTAGNAAVGVWIGVNDVRRSYDLDNWDDLITKSVYELYEQLQRVHDLGLRKFFVMTIPPLELTPNQLSLNETQVNRLKASIRRFNNLLFPGMEHFQRKNGDSKIAIIDTSDTFWNAVRDPASVKASDATCMNHDGVSCIWYDGDHPNIGLERQVAEKVWNLLHTDDFRL